MMRALSTLFVLTSAIVAGQRPSFAGSRPIGFPDLPNRTTTTPDGLGDRFGEGTTERLPVQANGDRDLIDRLSKLPIDKQPFWFINWQAIEADRKNPQSYPQRPSGFVDPVGPINGAAFSSNQGFSNNNQGFTSSNQGFPSNNQGFSSSNQGFPNGNQGFSNNNQGDPNNSFTNSINGVSLGELLPNNPGASSGGNSGFTNTNPAFSGSNQGFSPPSQGFSQQNQGFSPPNQGFSQQNQGFSPPNQGFTPPNQGFSPPNQGFTPPNQGFSPPNQGFTPPNQGFSPPNQGFSPSNQGFSPPNQGFSPPSQGSPPNSVATVPVQVYQIPNQNQKPSKPQEFTQSLISNQHFETKLPGRVNSTPSVESRFSSTSISNLSTSTNNDKPIKPGGLPGMTTNYNYKWNNSFHHAYTYNYKTNSSYYVPNGHPQPVNHHDIVKLE